jgi:3-hydroxyisobutyrate dehydrogenase
MDRGRVSAAIQQGSAQVNTVAILGLGAMGSRMARSLLRAGFRVQVWNRNPARSAPLIAEGAVVASTPAAAAQDAKWVLSMVRDDAASLQVWTAPETGALAAMNSAAIAIESSTLSVNWARELARHCQSRAIDLLEAPVVGTLPQADARQLIHLVGGDAAVLERALPVLEAIGGAIHHIGPHGTATALKLMVNTLLATQVAILAELLELGSRLDITPARALEVLAKTPVLSPAGQVAAQSILQRNFMPLFPIELAAKDLGYSEAAAAECDLQLPVTEAVARVLRDAVAAGLGGMHLTAVARLLLP